MPFMGRVLFALAQDPERHLRIGPKGEVDLNGGKGPWAQFVAERGEGDPNCVRLSSVGNQGKANRYGGSASPPSSPHNISKIDCGLIPHRTGMVSWCNS